MKTSKLILTLLLSLLPVLSSPAQMAAANDRVRVQVKMDTRSAHADIARSSSDKVTQFKTLNIQLSGKPKTPETRVMKWTAYGRDVQSNDVRVIDSGEIPVSLSSSGTQTTESKQISTTYTPDHSVVTSSGRGRGRSPRAKRVEGSGVKYLGYAIQVMDGTRLVGEMSDPVGIGSKK